VQRAVIRKALNTPALLTKEGKLSFKKIYATLRDAGCAPVAENLNLDRASREELSGNRTLVAFHRMGLLHDWMELSDRSQISVINLLADLGSPDQLDDDTWHMRIKGATGKLRTFPAEVIAFVDKLRVNPGFGRFAAMGLDPGRASYSIKALARLSEWMVEPYWPAEWQGTNRIDEEAAIQQCYPQALNYRPQLLHSLPRPAPTGNEVVDVALRQAWYRISGLIEHLAGPPSEVVVELAAI
jgi:CRISPR-associated endonuclease Csn1